MRRALFLAHAEVLHILRDRTTLAQILIMPVVQLLVLSNAATFAIRDTPTYIVDLDRTRVSRDLVARFVSSGHFRIVGESVSLAQADEALLDGQVTLALTIPHDFESSLVRSQPAPLLLTVNAEKGSAAGIVQSYATRIISAYEAELGARSRIDVRTNTLFNPTLNYRHYMVPGILVALVTMIGTFLTAQNIAREKELGTLEQLNVTPITRGQFIVAKLLPFWGLALLDFTVGLVVARFVFGVPMRGSLLLLFGAAALYMIAALAIGLFISTLADTQQQAMFVTFFIIVIYLLLSGLFTPIDSMAPWVRPIAELNPVRHFVTISRAVLVKGAGLREIAQPLGALVIFGVVTLTLAVRQYSKRTA
jgi:ABC-2 type transport system permease protein